MAARRVAAVLLVAILNLTLVTMVPLVHAQPVPVTSSWLRNPVTLDGNITSSNEWSDTTPVDLTLPSWPSGSQTVSARVWMKNDAAWLYVLERVGWADGPDGMDAGDMIYFWPGHSDLGGVRFNNSTIDYCQHTTGTTWVNDTSASPPGHNDTQGAASYDAVNHFYWFEYKRPLDSMDGYNDTTGWGYDWSFVAGGTYGGTGTTLLVEFWDYSTQTPYDVGILLNLSSPEMPVDCYSLVQPVTIDGKWTSPAEWSDAVEVPMYPAAGNGHGYFRIKHDTSYLYVLVESLADTAVEYNSTKGFGDWMQVFFDTLYDHGLPSTDDYFFSAYYVNPTLTSLREWVGDGYSWDNVPLAAGAQAKVGLDTGYSPHGPYPHVVGEFKIPLSLGLSLGSEFGFYTHFGDSSEAYTTVFYWPGPVSAPQRYDPGSWAGILLSRGELGYSLVEVPLVAGWNLVSLPLVPRTNAISTVLAALIAANEVSVVWSYTGTPRAWKSYTPGKTSTLTTMVDGDAYWIYMTKPDTLGVSGAVIPPTVTPPTYTLLAGWNLVGFKPQPTVANETVGAYLSSILSKYDTSNVWILDISSGDWIRATDSTWLRPGEAMWIYMTAPAILRP